MLTTFPAEWVTGAGDEAAEEGPVDEVVLLQSALDDRGIEWTLVPDLRAPTTDPRKAYKLKGVRKPLSHDETVTYLKAS